MPLILIYGLIVVSLVGLDQWLKFWVSSNLVMNQVTPLIDQVISLTKIHNSGAAWSILSGQRWIFILIGLAALIIISYFIYQKRNSLVYVGSLLLLLSGALGNLIDRVINGYVVDMFQLEFMNFPIFNLADVYITIGITIFVILVIKE